MDFSLGSTAKLVKTYLVVYQNQEFSPALRGRL